MTPMAMMRADGPQTMMWRATVPAPDRAGPSRLSGSVGPGATRCCTSPGRRSAGFPPGGEHAKAGDEVEALTKGLEHPTVRRPIGNGLDLGERRLQQANYRGA